MIGGILVFFLAQLFPCLECMYQPRLCDGVSSSPMAGLLWLCGCCFVGSVVRLGPLDSCRVARLVRVALPPCAVCLGAAARTKVNTAAQVTGVFCQNAIESASLDQAGLCGGSHGRLRMFVDKHHNLCTVCSTILETG